MVDILFAWMILQKETRDIRNYTMRLTDLSAFLIERKLPIFPILIS